MKVAYITDSAEKEQELLRSLLGEGIEIVFIPYDKRDEAVENAGDFNAVIGARIPREFWEKATDCKYMLIPFTGIPPQDMEVLPDFPHVTILNSHFNAQYVANWGTVYQLLSQQCQKYIYCPLNWSMMQYFLSSSGMRNRVFPAVSSVLSALWRVFQGMSARQNIETLA